MQNAKKFLTIAIASGLMAFPSLPMVQAAEAQNIDEQIAQQQALLKELNAKKAKAENEQLTQKINDLSRQLSDLKKQKSSYDAEGAIEAISAQIHALQQQIDNQQKDQDKLMQAIDKLDRLTNGTATPYKENRAAGVSSNKYLINPGPNPHLSYTQDAINNQGNSTMVFKYAPNQLYKIYCRPNYLTDLALHEGEKVTFVGGGDTASWAINSTTVAGVPHIYIKPVVEKSTTNIIITTNKRSYQIILNTSDWYNPMVTWTYEDEALQKQFQQDEHDEKTITDRLSGSYASLNFEYTIKGKGANDREIPSMCFDDGEKTIIKFAKTPKKAPAIFVRERGHKAVSLVDFRIKDNCYIIERVIEEAELHYNTEEVVTIKRKG